MAVISGVLKDPFGNVRDGVTIELVAIRTSTTVLVSASSSSITDTAGRYSLNVEPGQYNVMVSTNKLSPVRVGSITVTLTSKTGTLNDFLTMPGEEDITPEIVQTVDRMRAEAANSAAAAKISETNAAAAMTNALSKVDTAEQSVAGPVTFATPITFDRGFTSRSEVTFQAKTLGSNIIQRFKDLSAVEKGAIYFSSDTGLMNFRWAGAAYTMQGREDGFLSVPKGIMLGGAFPTPGDVNNAITSLTNYPFIFRGADTAGLDNPNTFSIGTFHGFSVVPTYTGALSSGVEVGKPVFSVNARTGNVFVQNGLTVKGRPVGFGGIPLGTADLNTITEEGPYYQNLTVEATTARHYPTNYAGSLIVINSRAGSTTTPYVTQQYHVYNDNKCFYQRTFIYATLTWTEWEVFWSRSLNDTRYLQIGAYGLGAEYRPLVDGYTLASDYRMNGAWYANISIITDSFAAVNSHIFNISGHINRSYFAQLAIARDSDKIGFRRIQNNVVGSWREMWHNGNTTVDANGFIKKASPIVKLFGDGHSELNEQSQGVTTERVDTGHYIVHGVFGFNSDPAWGGPAGGIEIPTDQNKRPLIWVDYTVLPDGDLEIKTYHRAYKTGPEFTRNIVLQDGKAIADGTPIDIPAGRWIDLRVEMPVGDEPEPDVVPDTDQTEQLEVTDQEEGKESGQTETESENEGGGEPKQ